MIMYSNIKTRETIIEFWGASTKHPDSVIKVEHDNPLGWLPLQDLGQTLLLSASQKIFSFHAIDCAKKGIEILELRERLWREKREDDIYPLPENEKE